MTAFNHQIAYSDPRVLEIVEKAHGKITYKEARRRVMQSIEAKNGRVTDRPNVEAIVVPVGQRKVKSDERLALEARADELGIPWQPEWANSSIADHIRVKEALAKPAEVNYDKMTKAQLIELLGGTPPTPRKVKPKTESVSKNARAKKPLNEYGVAYQTRSSEPCRVMDVRYSGGRSYFLLDGIPLKETRVALSSNGITWRKDLGEWTAAGAVSVNVVAAILNR